MRQSVTISRQQLYQQVWETPMLNVASSYGISGNGLAKICEKLRVPYPSRGYWAKVRAGKPVGRRARLPAVGSDTPTKWTIIAAQKPIPRGVPTDVAEAVAKARAVGEEGVQRLSMPFRFRHPLVVKWKKVTANGHRAHPRLSGIRNEIENPQVLGRRLRILDVLFIAVEEAGGQVCEKKSTVDNFVACFESNEVKARLVERRKQVREPIDPRSGDEAMYRDRPWNQKLVATGTLVFRIESFTDHPYQKEWKDSSDATIEDQLPLIMSALVMNAYYVGLREKRFAEERERREAEQRRREEIARQKQAEQQKLDELEKLATQWQRAEAIRAYVDAVDARASKEDMTAVLGEWITWAKQKVQELDGVSILLERHSRNETKPAKPKEEEGEVAHAGRLRGCRSH